MSDATLSAMVLRLINKRGRTVTFKELGSAPANPSFPFEGPTDPEVSAVRTLSTKAVFVEPDSLQRLGITTKVEELLQRSDRIMLVPGSVGSLDGYNVVVDEGQTHTVTAIETLKPGTTTLLHFVGTLR